MSDYKISRKAIADLDAIYRYTRQEWSEEQAAKYYTELYTAIKSLPNLPTFIVRNYSSVRLGLLGLYVGRHIIFYRKHSDGTIWVDRILHERMDFARHL